MNKTTLRIASPPNKSTPLRHKTIHQPAPFIARQSVAPIPGALRPGFIQRKNPVQAKPNAVEFKAPPVYRPAPQPSAAPPIYRPRQITNSSAQPKAISHQRIETRPDPAVQHRANSSAFQLPSNLASFGHRTMMTATAVQRASTETSTPPVVRALSADELANAVIAQFKAWNKDDYYATGVTGPTPNGKTDQTITTTQEAFTLAREIYGMFLADQNPVYHHRYALSRGEAYEATDIIISTDNMFRNTLPKMVFHIWGKFR